MSCKRCEDIHTAQKGGKIAEPCKCNCHVEYSTTGGTTRLTDLTTNTSDGTINFNTGTATTNCVCLTSSVQCDDCKKQGYKCQDIHFPTTTTSRYE